MRLVTASCLLVSTIGIASTARADEEARSDERSTLLSAVAPVVEEQPDGGRINAGFNFNGGAGLGGGAGGGVVAAALHFGWQFNHRVAAYLQGAMFGWFSSEKTSADHSVSANGLVGWQLTPLFAWTHRGQSELAIGPSIDRLITANSASTGSMSTQTSSGEPVGYSGNYFGAHGRLALHFARAQDIDSPRRTSATLGTDLHASFARGSVLTFLTVGVGADWY